MRIWHQIATKLKENVPVYLLTVIENSGSSPGRKGFKMMIAEDGFIFGSIGGGIMEFNLVEEVKKLLKEKKYIIFLKKQIHQGSGKDGSGMICSGAQTIVFHPLSIKDISCIENITTLKKGTLKLTKNSLAFVDTSFKNKHFHYEIQSEKKWLFEEKIGYSETLYIIGAGHVSLAVSEIFTKLGFYIILLDNRKNLNTYENNDYAHQKKIIDYNLVSNYIENKNTSYVAIMTNTYKDDKLVLSKVIKNNYAFIGVLGSTHKIETMWGVLLKEGYLQQEIDKIYAPIGLSIKSETPEEIAISIAAQIIQLKNVQNTKILK